MLKKVMIICLALSFVFIGGIAFATDGEQGALNEGNEISPGPAPLSGDVNPDGSELETPTGPNSDFISPNSSMIIAKIAGTRTNASSGAGTDTCPCDGVCICPCG